MRASSRRQLPACARKQNLRSREPSPALSQPRAPPAGGSSGRAQSRRAGGLDAGCSDGTPHPQPAALGGTRPSDAGAAKPVRELRQRPFPEHPQGLGAVGRGRPWGPGRPQADGALWLPLFCGRNTGLSACVLCPRPDAKAFESNCDENVSRGETPMAWG